MKYQPTWAERHEMSIPGENDIVCISNKPTVNQDNNLELIWHMTQTLIDASNRKGIVVTICTMPSSPLRMGNYEMVGSVRLKTEPR